MDARLHLTAALIALSALASAAAAQTTTRVSVDSAGNQANGPSWAAFEDMTGLSADGRYVVFSSTATNLVPKDTNGLRDVFVHDRQTGLTTRVSVDSAGNEANGEAGDHFSISADGRYVAFDSPATNLVPGDTNGFRDIFVHDRATGQTTRVNLSNTGSQANDWSWRPVISGDGSLIAFGSVATNLVPNDTNGKEDVFAYDRTTSQLSRVSVSSTGVQGNDLSGAATLSEDGRYLGFISAASNFVSPDSNLIDIFVKDLLTGTVLLVTKSSAGVQALGQSYQPTISPDGRFVTYVSQASNLVPGDTNGWWDVFVFEIATQTTTRVSIDSSGAQANHNSWYPYLSGDGRYVAFGSVASNLVPGDTNGFPDTFLHDRWTEETTRVSVGTGGQQGNSYSGVGAPSGPWWLQLGIAISADGRYIAFGSEASNLIDGDTNGVCDVFIRDREACGWTQRYCLAAINSTGMSAYIGSQGSTSIAANEFMLTASGLPPTHVGLYFFGSFRTQIPFGEGWLCVTGNQQRLLPAVLSSPEGTCSCPLDFTDPSSPASSIQPGVELHFQLWYRDPQPVAHGFNLTDALTARFCP